MRIYLLRHAENALLVIDNHYCILVTKMSVHFDKITHRAVKDQDYAECLHSTSFHQHILSWCLFLIAIFLARKNIRRKKYSAELLLLPRRLLASLSECPPRSDKSPSRLTTSTWWSSTGFLPRSPVPCNCSLVRDIKGWGGPRRGVIDDEKGASEGRLASSIPLRGSGSARALLRHI